MQPRLIGLKVPVMGLTVNLSPIETTLGREVGNTAVLNSASVSRRHARIVPQGDGYAIEDLGSANGTKVNGLPIAGLTLLNNGDRVDLGEVSLLYEAPTSSSASSAEAATPRKPEVGSAERAAQFTAPSGSDASGCNPLGNLLNDLSGALPGLMKYLLPALLILLALFCLGSLLMIGVSSLSQLFNHGGGSSSRSSTPPASKPPASPPPPAQDSQQDSGSAKITILSTSVVKLPGTDHPTLLVKWRNDSDQPVAELDGTVVVHMPDGHQDTYPKMRIYAGPPIPAGQTHEDTGTGDGVVIATDADPKPDVIPTEVK